MHFDWKPCYLVSKASTDVVQYDPYTETNSMAHFAHYVRRTVVEVNYEDPSDPWFAENQPDNQGFEAPAYHVTRSLTGPAARVSGGDTIWLFSQLTTPWGNFPPALDAKRYK